LTSSAQHRRAARLDRRHHAALGSAEMVRVGVPIRRAVAAENIRHLQLGTHRGGSGRRRDDDGERGRLQELQRAGGGAHFAGGKAQVAGGGAQAAMPEQQLDGAQVSAGFEQMDGKGMAQGVRRDRLADPGPVARMSADILHGSRRDRLSRPVAREQPVLGPCFAPVGPEDVQEPGREHDVAVLATFARRHADHHALAVDGIRRQADGLGDPQSSRIANGQDGPVLRALDRLEEPADLLGAHDDRKRLRLAAGRDGVVEVPISPEGDLVEEADGRDRDQDRAGREMLVPGEMELVGPDIVRPEQVWRPAEVAGELGNLLQIRPLGVRCEIADLHVFGHALAEWGHGRLLCETKRATGRRSIVAQSRPSEDGEVNRCRARPNALDPPMTFQPNGQTGPFSPNVLMPSSA